MEALPDLSIDIVHWAAQFLPQWFIGGEKMENHYWKWTLIALICWTVLAAGAGLIFWGIFCLSLVDTYGEDQASGQMLLLGVSVAVIVLPAALAPWVIGGIVFCVHWWRSRASSPHEAS